MTTAAILIGISLGINVALFIRVILLTFEVGENKLQIMLLRNEVKLFSVEPDLPFNMDGAQKRHFLNVVSHEKQKFDREREGKQWF